MPLVGKDYLCCLAKGHIIHTQDSFNDLIFKEGNKSYILLIFMALFHLLKLVPSNKW